MTDDPQHNSRGRTVVAAVIGLAGAVAIWIISPYSSLLLRNANITDSYIPAVVMFFTLLLVLGVNPILRLIGRRGPLSTRQLALIVGLLLIACVLPNIGLFGPMPMNLAKTPSDVQNDRLLGEQYRKMNLPPSLFPERLFPDDSKQTPQARTPGAAARAGDRYVNGLQPGESVPWHAWLAPLVSWGIFLLFCWMMMIGLGMITFPQWRHNERLAFPLLTLQQSLIAEPGKDRLAPPLLRTRSFWIAAGTVFLIYFLFGAKVYYPDSVPEVPLRWNFAALFAEDPWRQMPGYIRFGRLYFLFIGIAFFMPTRISFSIWFFLVAYGMYRGFASVYGWLSAIEKTDDQRFGAVFALTLWVLLVGRAHWARVFRSLFSRPAGDEDRRNRRSGRIFLIGIVGMFAWLMWAGFGAVRADAHPLAAFGKQALWAFLLVGFAFMISLLIARIVAETGMPFVRLLEKPLTLMQMAPISLVAAASLFFAGIIDTIFSVGSRVSVTAMSMHALGVDEHATPRHQRRLGTSLIGVLLVGLVIAGAANLLTSYNNSRTLDGFPVHSNGSSHLKEANVAIKELNEGQLSNLAYNRWGYFAIGAALASGLYYLCLTVPVWPIHPFGLMLVDSGYGHETWASIFIGWVLQLLIVKYGGARLYRLARPVFLGLIIGEILAGIFWALVPVVLVAMNKSFIPVYILPT